jgi:hypothetical protein
MLRSVFGGKCIIVHFLVAEKDKKTTQCRDAEFAEKRYESTEREKRRDLRSGNVSYTPVHLAEGAGYISVFFVKSFISNASHEIAVSPLLATLSSRG